MKKFILFLVVAVVLTSCGLETYQCHSYGETNRHTKRGHKSQRSYSAKHRI
ncbi:MAG: lipoprotein [Cyclobacteriaceae bacterium]